ncbi:unnamed protein product [Prorocentrum cordatum]|uniref:Uncharacterized protein n=1 Tax=Prorocentrum cordatum TaxID=2364126 RepID=A0ABN9QSF2_9DINO|nr:unnamed protein product [Polarella glacialis]
MQALPHSLALALLAVSTSSAPDGAVRFEATIHKHAHGIREPLAVLLPSVRRNRTLRPAHVTAVHSSFFQVGSEEGSESEAANGSARPPQRGGEADVRSAAAVPSTAVAAAAPQRSLRPPGALAGAAETRPRGLDLLLTNRGMVADLAPEAPDAPVAVVALALLAAAFALLAAWTAVCRVLHLPSLAPLAASVTKPPAAAAAAAAPAEEKEEAPVRCCVCDQIKGIPRCDAAEVERFLCKAEKYDCALSVPLSSRRLVRLEARVAAPAKGCPVLEAPFTRRACVGFSASASRRSPALRGGPLLPVFQRGRAQSGASSSHPWTRPNTASRWTGTTPCSWARWAASSTAGPPPRRPSTGARSPGRTRSTAWRAGFPGWTRRSTGRRSGGGSTRGSRTWRRRARSLRSRSHWRAPGWWSSRRRRCSSAPP